MEKVLKIFSYLPNPRVWKAVIAGNICEVSVEVIGDKPKQLGKWLWDSNPRELEEQEMSEDSPHFRVGKRGFRVLSIKPMIFLKHILSGLYPRLLVQKVT